MLGAGVPRCPGEAYLALEGNGTKVRATCDRAALPSGGGTGAGCQPARNPACEEPRGASLSRPARVSPPPLRAGRREVLDATQLRPGELAAPAGSPQFSSGELGGGVAPQSWRGWQERLDLFLGLALQDEQEPDRLEGRECFRGIGAAKARSGKRLPRAPCRGALWGPAEILSEKRREAKARRVSRSQGAQVFICGAPVFSLTTKGIGILKYCFRQQKNFSESER